MATNMDHNNQLLCRNAVLQAELRLVKQQLDQAHRSTNYLLERMSLSGTPRTNVTLEQLEKAHEQVLRENAHLKSLLTITCGSPTPSSRRIGSRTAYGVRRTLRSGRDHSQSFSYHRATDSAVSESGNLLDLEDDFTPSPTATPTYTTTKADPTPPLESSEDEDHRSRIPEMVGRPIRHKKIANTSTGLGITGTTSFDSSAREPAGSHASGTAGSTPAGSKSGFILTDSDGNETFFQTPSPTSSNPLRGPRASRGESNGPAHFAFWERQSLMGAAIFIEDKDEAEIVEYWEEYGKQHPRHSAEEWKNYYHETIRPAYLAKQSPKMTEDEKEQEAPTAEAVQKQDDEPKLLAETSFTSGTTKPDEILFDDDEEAAQTAESSFNSTTTASGGVALVEVGNVALDAADQSGVVHSGSESIVSAQESESTIRAPTTFAAAFNPLALSVHADPAAFTNQTRTSSPEHEPLASDVPIQATQSTEDKPRTPWSFGPAYNASLEEAKAFSTTATRGGQRSRPRRQTPEDDYVVAPPTPAFGVAAQDDRGEAPARRDSPPKVTRYNYSRTYYPMHEQNLFYKPRLEDPNAYRTVLITGVPPTITLAQVLDKVRGGKIFSSAYHDTANFRTAPPIDTNTVSIIFISGREASKFVKHTQHHPILFTTSSLDPPTQAEVLLLKTPTRSISTYFLRDAIPKGLTRIMYLHNLTSNLKDPETIIGTLQQLNPDMPRPLRAGYVKDGIMVLEYASMAEADVAWDVVNKNPMEFPGIVKGSLGDPCAEALVWKKRGEAGEREKEGHGGDIAELSEGEADDECGGENEVGDENAEMVYVDREEDAKMMEG
ncbi:hypothetical protein CLAFUW4_10251 [Fulvia fulva]|uniref:Uncharacterized protein n=1 Tax=Passalora fulva TaxID=5499 RepID=A0A9Q8LGN6_PASFU|nr:uncharacterized protein CLAFUR5_04866 [Fulvia fulva]KAK4615418.1 hypothetical protein CLAFUR4_10255 [Fulvia fulva]KAK4617266.1 hypothetical protein CLAFUR0_10253 [Fulvia fulva]UJO17052.1 hypothetical protein CLAFUR5_04866 [Fulvia fulva]WPV19403.1 hypothetical protein CLAFUW4_10251 [Fulvia fulva]WPV34697.1 hypothetical protein CLAFUW7_10251 [Fulvia fulva]